MRLNQQSSLTAFATTEEFQVGSVF